MGNVSCDGNFNDDSKCGKLAKFLARSQIDPVMCVYYCCENHKESYKQAGFIIEKL